MLDQYGNIRTEKDPDGKAQMVFFDHVKCPYFCLTTSALMADAITLLAKQGHDVTSIMITISPDLDTHEFIREILETWHPNFTGLTETHEVLEDVYDLFAVEVELSLPT